MTPAPQDPRSLSRLSIPTSHFGGGSQTGRAPFIFEIGNGQVLVHAVCVTATVLTYYELPCLLNTEHDGSPARLNRTAINNKKCQISGGIDHSDRLAINLGVGPALVDSVANSGPVRQPTGVCASVPGSVFSLCSSALVSRPCVVSRTLLAYRSEIGSVLIH